VLLLLHQEPPLNSIGLAAMSVEIVLGATAPAGVAATPGESQTQSTSAPEEKPIEVEQTEPKATEQEQTVEVAKQETAPEQKTEAPAQAEPKPSVAMVESPNPEMATATPRETPPDATEVTLLPQPDEPVENKPDPKPAQATPPKPVKNAAPAKEQRRIAAPTRETAAKEAKASAPSTQANNVGVGRSDRDTNYPGLVSAHLRRYQQYPTDARSRGAQGTASVTFGIGGSGGVTSVRLARSSGVGSIDQEVQAMVRRASPFPAPPGGRAQSFTVPVNFRLN
jgi:protein TonB